MITSSQTRTIYQSNSSIDRGLTQLQGKEFGCFLKALSQRELALYLAVAPECGIFDKYLVFTAPKPLMLRGNIEKSKYDAFVKSLFTGLCEE